MHQYVVITADIIDSKTHQNFNKELAKSLSNFQSPALLTPFTISRGDELQALVKNLGVFPKILRDLRYQCRPYQLRIGVGLGKIEEFILGKSSWEMNGEVFHYARQALENLGKIKKPTTALFSGCAQLDLTFNTILSLTDTLIAGWTRDQWEAVQTYEAVGTYAKAAEKLDVSWQNIQKHCHAANWETIRDAEINTRVLLLQRSHSFLHN